ncbi:TOMM precursor leader peptide-binding protein [Streptomyces sp. NPDC005408]|uniref:TOMM precursor leader peptide-binding protein n=1 Tax=Streptomyces sp. NPDC005408 TaxID=3155341 RepID=UPI0033A045AF
MERPRVKAHYLREVVDGSKVFLLAEGKDYLVQGRAAALLLPYLDGTRTVPDIIQLLSGTLSIAETLTALRRYEAAGHLAEGRPDLPEPQLAYWDAQGIDPAAVLTAAADGVSVLTGRSVPCEPVLAALRETGLTVRTSPLEETGEGYAPGEGLTVVLVDDYLDPALERINAAHLAAERPWLLAKPGGVTPWIGPFLQPGHTGCWSCLAQRLGGNRQVERYLAGKRGDQAPLHPSHAVIPAGAGALAGLLAAETGRTLAQLATGSCPSLEGRMVTLDLGTLTTEEHELIRQPQCASCGDPALVTERSPKVVLSASPARHTTDGGYRVQAPQLTFDRLKKHISPYLGAITKLGAHEESEGGNGITYSFTAGHNFAMVNDNMDLLRRNMRGQSGGKGRSEMQAKVSAVCEAIERYSGVWRGNEPVTRAAYRDLDPETAVHPDELLHFSPGQSEGRAEWNAHPAHRLQLVPDPFDTGLQLDWSSAWSLTHDRERQIPSGYVWYGHPDLDGHFYCVGDSNGSASGNTLEEAILQGYCEVVERDAVALWWYNRLRLPAFDLDSLGDPYVDTMRAFYDSMDRDLWVIDITSDLGIPVFAAVSNRRHEVQDIMVGFGAHPDPKIAAIRALTEVNQFLPYVDRRDAEGNTLYRSDDPETLTWCKEAKLQQEPWLLPDPAAKPSTLGDFEPLAGDDLAGHIQDCVRRAEAAGIEVIVLDQTRPDLDLNVVKVIAPGMRHFWRRLGAGRLYDVPVRMGLLEEPRTEDEMNPWNVFF